MTSACGPRSTPASVPVSAQTTQPAETPTPPVAVEPPRPVPAPALPRPDISSSGCDLLAQPGEPVATVGLGERVDPSHAPRPSNDSERLLFRQLYETLVRVDCNGEPGPGLA